MSPARAPRSAAPDRPDPPPPSPPPPRQAIPTARERARPRETPRALVGFVGEEQKRGEVERYELHAVSSTSSRFVTDFDGTEGGGAAEQIADLLWARALDDSENSRDVAAVNFEVQSVMVPGQGREGGRKRFVVPMPSRIDSRPLEQPDQDGLLSIGMRGLNKATELANQFTIENQDQLASTFDRAVIIYTAAQERAEANLDRLTANFERQLAWKEAEITRMQTRLERIEERHAKTIELAEELQTAEHERQLQMIKLVEGEDRKTKVIDLGVKLIGPALLKRYAPSLLAPGAPANAAPPPAAPASLSANEQEAFAELMRVLFKTPELLERIEAVLKDTPAEVPFALMLKTLFEEHVRRNTTAAAAHAAAEEARATASTPTNGVPS